MADSNKVLIITYYWPPSGGSGVQRWLKFVKYLPQLGWQPYVFTPENPSFDIKDSSLLKHVPEEAEIIHFPIWEPYDAFLKISKVFGGASSNKPTAVVASQKKSLFQRITTWVRGNFFIPDPRRFWVKPSVGFLEDFLDANRITKIITTGPPHSMHLIGLKLKERNPKLMWIADFRDPWSEWGFLDSLSLSTFARNQHRKLEEKVLRTADRVVTITPFYVRHFARLGNRKVDLLTNGFDDDDFANLVYVKSSHFVIRHVGIINEKCDPRPFMHALAEWCDENPVAAEYLILEFIGEVHPEFQLFVRSSKMAARVKFPGSMPHAELMKLYGSSSLLLMVLTGYKDAEGYMPGKLFEYIATGLPILGIGPENGDAAALLNESGAGVMIDGSNRQRIKSLLAEQFAAWSNSTVPVVKKSQAAAYSRKAITQQLINVLQVRP
ncbi:MAG TPA: glycosyl transferase [Chryseosolibacter sp.]